MSQKAYISILKCIVEDGNLLMLNLSHNVLIMDPKSFKLKQTEEAKLMRKDKMAKFKKQFKMEKQLNQ